MSPELIFVVVVATVLVGLGFTGGVEFALHIMRKRMKAEERKSGAAE